MTIHGLSHVTFRTRDLDAMARLLCAALGAEERYDGTGPGGAFARTKHLVLGGVWIALIDGDPPPSPGDEHVAFAVDEEALEGYARRLTALGVPVLPDRPRLPGEGRSLYFRDVDGRLFELHTGSLGERLAAYG